MVMNNFIWVKITKNFPLPQLGEHYVLRNGNKVLEARYINRTHNLGPVFSGRVKGDNRDVHLTLENAESWNWEIRVDAGITDQVIYEDFDPEGGGGGR